MDAFQLRGKCALVTGAGSGIGEAIARVFALAGARVIVADVNEDTGNQSPELFGANKRNFSLFYKTVC